MLVTMHDPPREQSGEELEYSYAADCPSLGDPGPPFMPYLCTLDAGHPGLHQAGVEGGVYIASWEDGDGRS